MEPLVLHTTRGALAPATLDEAREMHNAFVGGGPQPGIEIARSLGDVGHAVYAGVGETGAASGELLFLDVWTAPEGMEAFFANPFAREAGDRLYACRAESEWAPAPGSVPLQFPAVAGAPARYLALVEVPVPSADDAVAALDDAARSGLGAARRRGQLSHQLFVRETGELAARPAANARHGGAPPPAGPVAVLALSSWPALDGLREHLADPAATAGLAGAAVSVWEQAGGFVEW